MESDEQGDRVKPMSALQAKVLSLDTCTKKDHAFPSLSQQMCAHQIQGE
jgi:hypothetical protein